MKSDYPSPWLRHSRYLASVVAIASTIVSALSVPTFHTHLVALLGLLALVGLVDRGVTFLSWVAGGNLAVARIYRTGHKASI